jgi:hypothetical protein
VHLSKKTLDHLCIGATASPEVYVEPFPSPEMNTEFRQGLHRVELSTLQKLCHVMQSMEELTAMQFDQNP